MQRNTYIVVHFFPNDHRPNKNTEFTRLRYEDLIRKKIYTLDINKLKSRDKALHLSALDDAMI